nr:unnamed protein product [Callosobruchus analis]
MSDNCFRAIDFYLKIFGVWLDNSTRPRKVLCIMWSSILFCVAFSFSILEAIQINIKDLKLFFKVFGMFSAHVMGLLKYCVIMFNHEELSSLKSRLRSRRFNYETCVYFDAQKMISEAAGFCNRFVTFTFFAYLMVGISAHISAVSRLNIEEDDIYFQGNSTCYDYLPYAFYIPFDADSIRRCKIALFVMDFAHLIMGSYFASYDATFCCLLKCLDTNLQILSSTTKHIRERLLTKNSLSDDTVVLYDESLPEFEEEMYNEIKRCNHNLEFLLRITRDIDDIFSMTMMLQCITSTFMMASSFFVASMLSPFDPELYSLLEFMLATLAELCTICFFADIVTQTISIYSRSLYECNWYSTSKRFKKCILIMMTRLQRPVTMTAGKFLPLGLSTTISVIKGSYSYAAMYRSLGAEI